MTPCNNNGIESSTGVFLNQSSPFFIHPSDGTSSVTVTLVLNVSNYHSRARSLGGKMKFEFVDGTIPSVTYNFDPIFHAWNHCNMLIHSWILKYVSPSISQSIVFMENDMDVRNDVKKRFAQGDLVII